MRVWRLTRRPFADLSGVGADLHGGRWTSPRTPVVYAAIDAALAALEVRANLDLGFDLLPDDYVLLGIDTNYLGFEDAPPLTDSDECRAFGDRWLSEGRSALLRVPSVVMPESHNILINPRHRHARVACQRPWRYALCAGH
jgi:RES domain-containing protein